MPGQPRSVISADSLTVGYGKLVVARSVNLSVAAGEVVAMVGPNGAGKTTTLLTLAGLLPGIGGTVTWCGRQTTAPLHKRARDGLAFIPEERSVVMGMSVRDNLRLGQVTPAAAVQLFPELASMLGRKAGLLSGGEQQMLTLSRAILRTPKAIIVDELSLGLAPLVADRLVFALRDAASTGIAILLVEQNLRRAVGVADRIYLMRDGRISNSGSSSYYRDRPDALEELVVGPGSANEALVESVTND